MTASRRLFRRHGFVHLDHLIHRGPRRIARLRLTVFCSDGLRIFRERFGGPTALVVAGGVAVNQAIRRALGRVASEQGTVLVAPPPELCTDNGAMIAWAGAERLARGMTDTLDVAPRARWPLDGGSEWPRRDAVR